MDAEDVFLCFCFYDDSIRSLKQVPRIVAYLGIILLLSSARIVLAQGATSLGEFQDSVYYTPVITHPNPLSLFLGGAVDFHIVKDGIIPAPL